MRIKFYFVLFVLFNWYGASVACADVLATGQLLTPLSPDAAEAV